METRSTGFAACRGIRFSNRWPNAARELTAGKKLDPAAAFLATQKSWDANRFVDLCEAIDEGTINC